MKKEKKRRRRRRKKKRERERHLPRGLFGAQLEHIIYYEVIISNASKSLQ